MADVLTVGVSQAHNRLSELIELVENGATVAISKRGVVAARLVPAESPTPRGNGPALAQLCEEMLANRGSAMRTETEIAEGIQLEREAWD